MKGEEVLVCNLKDAPSPFLDNENGECAKCKRGIHFRPHAAKITTKVCYQCFINHYAAPKMPIGITKEALKELKNMEKN